MTNFVTQVYLSYKGLFVQLNPVGYFSNAVMRPVLMMTIIGVVGKFADNPEGAERYIVGMTVFSIPMVLSWGIVQSVSNERGFGVLIVNFASPVNRLLLYLSRAVLHLPNAVLGFVCSLLGAWLILGVSFGETNWTAVVLGLLVMLYSCSMFALFVGTFAVVMRDNMATLPGSHAVLLLLTAIVVPREAIPLGIGAIGRVLPVTNGLEAFRGAFQGLGLTSLVDSLMVEAAVGTGFLVGGFLMFRLMEAVAKRRGSLETEL